MRLMMQLLLAHTNAFRSGTKACARSNGSSRNCLDGARSKCRKVIEKGASKNVTVFSSPLLARALYFGQILGKKLIVDYMEPLRRF